MFLWFIEGCTVFYPCINNSSCRIYLIQKPHPNLFRLSFCLHFYPYHSSQLNLSLFINFSPFPLLFSRMPSKDFLRWLFCKPYKTDSFVFSPVSLVSCQSSIRIRIKARLFKRSPFTLRSFPRSLVKSTFHTRRSVSRTTLEPS